MLRGTSWFWQASWDQLIGLSPCFIAEESWQSESEDTKHQGMGCLHAGWSILSPVNWSNSILVKQRQLERSWWVVNQGQELEDVIMGFPKV